jgi:hypothetical protein
MFHIVIYRIAKIGNNNPPPLKTNNKNMIEYKYLNYPPSKQVEDILKELEKLFNEEGWSLVSHSHSQYGMSIILELWKESKVIFENKGQQDTSFNPTANTKC